MSVHSPFDEMGVANIGFLIENIGKETGELQYLRELVQNSIESICRVVPSRDGFILIDQEVVDGVPKLRITDNGTGMTPEEVSQNINRLSASAGTQAFDKNFGIGAKITAAVKNPHGVVYKAWKDGEGTLTTLGRTPDHRYGRIGWPNPVGEGYVHYLTLPDAEKPESIESSGVSVVLLGQSAADDTTKAPQGADLPTQWVSAYLERRYFELPQNVTLQVRRLNPILDSERGETRFINDTIRGQRHYLDKHSDARGRVEIGDLETTVWWWILNDQIVKGGKTWSNRGHVAAIFQGELHEVRAGTSRLSALKDFGVYAGHGRIVIYVQPTNVLGANASRTSLVLKNGQPVDYPSIGESFALRMPDELSLFMSGQVSSEHGEHRKAILKNLKEIEALLDQARFRRSQHGPPRNLQSDIGGRPGRGDDEERGPRRPAAPRPQDATGRLGNDYLRKSREEMERRLRGRRVENDDPMPRIRWDESGEDVPPGRAATYTPATHIVVLNAQCEFYMDILEWGVSEGKSRTTGEMDETALQSICRDEVRRWFEQAVAEAVVALVPVQFDPNWDPEAARRSLSDEALTAAVVSHRWHMMSAVKRGLSGRLGRSREIAAY